MYVKGRKERTDPRRDSGFIYKAIIPSMVDTE